MAILKAIKSGASLKRIIDYVTRKDTLDFSYMDGIECNPQTALYEMFYTRDKFSKYDGVQYIHLVYSLSPTESQKINMSQLLSNAKMLAEKTENFKNHQVLICAHDDKKHKHVHIVVNAVNINNGNKVRWYRTGLKALKEKVKEISIEQGLEIPIKGQGNSLGGYNTRLYQSVEKAVQGKYESWMLDIYRKILEIKNKAISKDDFINGLLEYDIKTTWTNRKTILFQDNYGHKVRNSRLEEVFKIKISKEDLENEFGVNQQLFEGEGRFKNSFSGTTEGTCEIGAREREFEQADISSAIRSAIDALIDATTKEQDSRAKRDDCITERTNRDIERERLNSQRKQRIKKEIIRKRNRSRTIYQER